MQLVLKITETYRKCFKLEPELASMCIWIKRDENQRTERVRQEYCGTFQDLWIGPGQPHSKAYWYFPENSGAPWLLAVAAACTQQSNKKRSQCFIVHSKTRGWQPLYPLSKVLSTGLGLRATLGQQERHRKTAKRRIEKEQYLCEGLWHLHNLIVSLLRALPSR